MNFLAIGAHPDDIELGCGGLLMKSSREGHNVFMYVLTRGEASGDPDERSQELINSAKFMKVKTLWQDNFRDTELTVNSKLINHIEYFIQKTNPDLILTHSITDYHHDHRAIAECTLEAARYHQNILGYEVPLTKNFNPQVFYDISDVIDAKMELFNLFNSQKDKMHMNAKGIRTLASYRAQQSRLNSDMDFVEAFEGNKMCIDIDLKLFKIPQKKTNKKQVNIDTSRIIEYVNDSKHLETVRNDKNVLENAKYLRQIKLKQY
jgi:LmbE family N-acetylglucosaminyl deacetylase